ncbi:MAG: aminotransferase class V-fold PLP-dependent enzyme [Bacteroidota bacterium]
MNWNEVRGQFPILNDYTYFNTARFCALPSAVVALQERYVEGLAHHGSWNFDEWVEKYENARAMASELMGCGAEATFFLPNVSTGINLASLYLRDRPVVLMDTDFPSVILPWQTNDHPIERIPRGEMFYDQLESSLREGNKILSVSWVQSADGFEIDLERVTKWCKAYDCTLVLDGTQGLGAIPFRVDPSVSMVFLSSSFKWLLAGYGVAIGYVSQDLLPRINAVPTLKSLEAGQQIL